MLLSKRGSHVGVILSFAIFIIFIVFLLIITQPALKTPSEKQYLVDYLKEKIVSNATSDLTTTSITLIGSEAPPEKVDCFIIDNIISGEKVVVKNKERKLVGSSIEENKLSVSWTDKKEVFFNIYYSNYLNPILTDLSKSVCISLTKDKHYSIVLTKQSQNIFEKRIREIISEHDENYAKLKTEFKIPIDSEFSFSFKLVNDTIIKTKGENVTGDKYVNEVSVPYFDGEASINYGTLRVEVW